MSAGNPLIRALSEGFRDGGVRCAINYPGFHSNELQDALDGRPISINEKTAMAFGWGASLAGRRTVVSFKNVGLNDAADAFLGSVLLGCHAGLAVVLFEDCDLQHSQNRQDSRFYQTCYGGLWFDPPDIQSAYDFARTSFALSEKLGSPVVLRVTNILHNMRGDFSRAGTDAAPGPEGFVRDPGRWVAHPVNAAEQERALVRRNTAIRDCVENLHEAAFREAAACSGGRPATIIYGAKRDLEGDGALRLFTLPLPVKGLRTFLGGRSRVKVHEHGAGFVAAEVERLLGSGSAASHSMNNRRLRFKYHDAAMHEFLFAHLRSVGGRVVVGDLGEYTMDPHRTLDACLCYGASVATAMGIASAGDRHVYAVTGEGAFAHSGITAYLEARHLKIPVTVIVFLNGGLRGTGGQAIPCDLPLVLSAPVLQPGDDMAFIGKPSDRDAGPRLFYIDTTSLLSEQ
jgi:indolepyruvate ferredoxin oxidoreductase alpha subunit